MFVCVCIYIYIYMFVYIYESGCKEYNKIKCNTFRNCTYIRGAIYKKPLHTKID